MCQTLQNRDPAEVGKSGVTGNKFRENKEDFILRQKHERRRRSGEKARESEERQEGETGIQNIYQTSFLFKEAINQLI